MNLNLFAVGLRIRVFFWSDPATKMMSDPGFKIWSVQKPA